MSRKLRLPFFLTILFLHGACVANPNSILIAFYFYAKIRKMLLHELWMRGILRVASVTSTSLCFMALLILLHLFLPLSNRPSPPHSLLSVSVFFLLFFLSLAYFRFFRFHSLLVSYTRVFCFCFVIFVFFFRFLIFFHFPTLSFFFFLGSPASLRSFTFYTLSFFLIPLFFYFLSVIFVFLCPISLCLFVSYSRFFIYCTPVSFLSLFYSIILPYSFFFHFLNVILAFPCPTS